MKWSKFKQIVEAHLLYCGVSNPDNWSITIIGAKQGKRCQDTEIKLHLADGWCVKQRRSVGESQIDTCSRLKKLNLR